MAQFVAQCPHCKQQFNAQSEWLGRQTNCPGCGMVFTITVPTQTPNVMPQPDNGFIAQCPHCKNQFQAQSDWAGQQTNCPSCGNRFLIVNSAEKKDLEETLKDSTTSISDSCKKLFETMAFSQKVKEFFEDTNDSKAKQILSDIIFWIPTHFKTVIVILIIVIGCVVLKYVQEDQLTKVIESEIREASLIKDAKERLAKLRAIQKGHPDNPLKERVDNLIREGERRVLAEEKRITEEIKRKIETANKADTVEEAIRILQEILSKHPKHSLSSEIKALIKNKEEYIEECNIVRNAIRKAKNVDTYEEAFRILEDIIKKYPNNYYTKGAKDLLKTYRYDSLHPKKDFNVLLCPIIPMPRATIICRFTIFVNGYEIGTFTKNTADEKLPFLLSAKLREGDVIKGKLVVENQYGTLLYNLSAKERKITSSDVNNGHFSLYFE